MHRHKNESLMQQTVDRHSGVVVGKLSDFEIDSTKLGPCDWKFNCSVIKHEGKVLLAYRCNEHIPHIRVVELDKDLQPKPSTDKRLKFQGETQQTYFEDPRLFRFQDRLWISFTCYSYEYFFIKVGCAEVRYDEEMEPFYPNFGLNQQQEGIEKNWQFFEYDGRLFFVYKICPHLVCEFNGNWVPHSVHETNYIINWPYGPIRGGSPPVQLGKYYYSFFHSRWDDEKGINYVGGLYQFEAEPPFNITKITKTPTHRSFEYNYANKAVVFPSGSFYDNGKWCVSYGYNDSYCRIGHHDHKQILADCYKPYQLRKALRLRDPMCGMPGGWKYKGINAHSFSSLKRRVWNKLGIGEIDLEEEMCLKLQEMDRGDMTTYIWIE